MQRRSVFVRNVNMATISTQRNKVLVLVLSLLLSMLPSVHAVKEGDLNLLAVTELEGGGFSGSLAHLHLEIRPGKGRVFIESFPASKIDTQLSTRFAKDIACKYLTDNCNAFDFFYTIKADSNLVGGPSAGAAATILTISVLNNIPLNQSVAMTGTINSGELIGPVGYVKTKIDAAVANGITKVLVPYEREKNETNQTIDLVEYGKEHRVAVVQVGTVDDALYEFTGKHYRKEAKNITINPAYLETMRNLSAQLCERSMKLQQGFNPLMIPSVMNDTWGDAMNLTGQGEDFHSRQRYYSSASYCFGANVKYTQLSLMLQNLTSSDLEQKIHMTKARISEVNQQGSNQKINTLTDLETYMVVKDRLIDANDLLNDSLSALEHNRTNASVTNLAFSIERVNSALSWSTFFHMPGKTFTFDVQALKDSCTNKIAEAEEHLQYLQLFYPGVLDSVNDDLQRAYVDYARGNYELCLYKATIAKAEINTILSTLGVEEQDLQSLLARKLDAAKKVIAEEQARNIFPILGYSYYEYAETLKTESPYSALLYSEYALELSNLDIYFTSPEQPSGLAFDFTPASVFLIFVGGVFFGFAIARAVYHAGSKTLAKPRKEALPGKKR